MEAATDPDSPIALGLLGDHRQRIYPEGQANLPGSIPELWHRPSLQMNHRSQRRIVELINCIWQAELIGRTEPTTGVQQHSRTERDGGVVRLFIGEGKSSNHEKIQREALCAEVMATESRIDAWTSAASGYQVLALEHKLAALRGGFAGVFEAMDIVDSDAARPQWHNNNSGPPVTRVLLEQIPALLACVDNAGTVDEFAATEVLTKYDRLSLLPQGESADSWLKKYYDAVQALAKTSVSPDAKVRDILAPVVHGQLFEVAPLLSAVLLGGDHGNDRAVNEEESRTDRVRRGLTQLLDAQWSELGRYRKYLGGRAFQATHQVVKGSEFEHVMVVMDDTEAGGFLFSYDKLFGAKALSKADLENAKAGKETAIDRTLRLLYVTCSRARESLALVLWASDPESATRQLKSSGWFMDSEILPVPEVGRSC
jgi:DNA helicase-2/ATP-dependent DNA helicase PcrA